MQTKLSDGSEVGGKVVVAEYKGHRFGTREFAQPSPDGSIPLVDGAVPLHLMRLELAVEEGVPDDVADEIAAIVESTDQIRRLTIPYRSTALVDWMEEHTVRSKT